MRRGRAREELGQVKSISKHACDMLGYMMDDRAKDKNKNNKRCDNLRDTNWIQVVVLSVLARSLGSVAKHRARMELDVRREALARI